LLSCWHNKWMGRRIFHWVSSVDEQMSARLDLLSTSMFQFYQMPAMRNAYQEMVDSEASAQPQTEESLRKAVLAAKPSTVLEVGCGSGRIYERLRDEGLNAKYIGVELSPAIISSNQEQYPDARWVCGDGYDLPVVPGTQDCAFSFYVLEHCVYPRRFLESMLAAIKPGGCLLLTFPDMVASGIFGSQALGLNNQSAKVNLRSGRLIHALIRLWDSRVRLPLALRRAASRPGAFLVNLQPSCLEAAFKMVPDIDVIYVANRCEVIDWARSKDCGVDFPAGQSGAMKKNVLIKITKPSCRHLTISNDQAFNSLGATCPRPSQ
jgi:SAM-dependent methyltransferase